MTAFSRLPRSQVPGRCVTLPRHAWADDYDKKPVGDVQVGLRLLSEDDIQTAKAEATKYVDRMYGETNDYLGRVEAYNDALVRWAVGRGCCSPTDVGRSYFAAEEETVRQALTSAGAKRVYAEAELFQIEMSPLRTPATDEDVAELTERLDSGDLHMLDPEKERRVRRVLTFVMEQLGEPEDEFEGEPSVPSQ